MAVLVEGISVVVRRKAIDARYPGLWDGFVADVPNQTLCADPYLARVGFMTPDDVKVYVARLDEFGIGHHIAGRTGDAVVIDQMSGPTSKCEWVEVGTIKFQGGEVTVARLTGEQTDVVAMPTGWTYAGSLSEKFGFVPTGATDRAVKFLRHEDGLDVFRDLTTGREVYVGRTSKK